MIKKYTIAENNIIFNLQMNIEDSPELDKFKNTKFKKGDIIYDVSYNKDTKCEDMNEITKIINIGANKKIYVFQSERIEYRNYSNDGMLISRFIETETQSELLINSDFNSSYRDMASILKDINIQGSFLEQDTLILHSNYIIDKGEAILFTGVSGAGKSTQGFLWNKYQNAEIINGDKSAIKFKDGRLYAFGVPFSGTSDICKNVTTPVKAIVLILKDDKNYAKQLSGNEALKAIWGQVAINRWNNRRVNKALDLVLKVISSTPIIELHCKPDKEATVILKKFLQIKSAYHNL